MSIKIDNKNAINTKQQRKQGFGTAWSREFGERCSNLGNPAQCRDLHTSRTKGEGGPAQCLQGNSVVPIQLFPELFAESGHPGKSTGDTTVSILRLLGIAPLENTS